LGINSDSIFPDPVSTMPASTAYDHENIRKALIHAMIQEVLNLAA
jgi:hypothetical protein